MGQPDNLKVLNLWVARFIPFILICTVGYATYVAVVLVAVNYLLIGTRQHGAAVTILVVYFILFLFMSLTYARLLYVVSRDPGYVPLASQAVSRREEHSEPNRTSSRATDGTFSTSYGSTMERTHPDCPGLENFYTKDIFECQSDGKPRWCTSCENWKPERSHHCREVARCVRKMDHFCPWVGGVVGENSFKFFIQFVAYTALYCTFVLIVMAFYIHQVRYDKGHVSAEWWVILGVAGFFGLFTFSMTVTSVRFALTNLSSIEVLGYKTQMKHFAVFVPKPTYDGGNLMPAVYRQVIYPVPKLDGSDASTTDVLNSAMSQHEERDSQAVRVFAVISTETGENPYHIGMLANWKEVMGESVTDWFLPIRRSPCCRHEDYESEYKLGSAVNRACERNGLSNPVKEGLENHVEMSQVNAEILEV